MSVTNANHLTRVIPDMLRNGMKHLIESTGNGGRQGDAVALEILLFLGSQVYLNQVMFQFYVFYPGPDGTSLFAYVNWKALPNVFRTGFPRDKNARAALRIATSIACAPDENFMLGAELKHLNRETAWFIINQITYLAGLGDDGQQTTKTNP